MIRRGEESIRLTRLNERGREEEVRWGIVRGEREERERHRVRGDELY